MFVAAASISGCGSAGSDIAPSGNNQTAKANVTIAVKFPSSDGAVKSLIPSGTQTIEVRAQTIPYTDNPSNPDGVLIATLTPAAPSTTIQINPGSYMVYARAFDSADINSRKMVGQTSSGGEIISGQANTIVLTFLDGQWTIVNDTDVPTPLVLSNGTLLKDFIVTSSEQMYKASKSSIDNTRPVGGGSGTVRLRFDNNTSARTYGGMISQFVGTTNSTILYNDGGYNLTKKCGLSDYFGIPCDENAGDQIVMISGKDSGGDYQSGGYYEGTVLYGSADTLLPGGGLSSFTDTQSGAPIDLNAALTDTTITGGNIITGGIVEWRPSTISMTTLGTPPVAKTAKSSAIIKAQSTNTPYAITVKNYETIVCSESNPQNRGTWTFANNSSAGKVVLGSRVCYTNNPFLSNFNPKTYQYGIDSGDYSYGLAPANGANLGDYCHQWDYSNNVCLQQLPGNKDVYMPWNFKVVKSTAKTSINYGSFKFNFWAESTQSGNAYIYPLRAKGSAAVSPAQ
jgi:hypothetical protein